MTSESDSLLVFSNIGKGERGKIGKYSFYFMEMFNIKHFSLNLQNYPIGVGMNVSLINMTESDTNLNFCSNAARGEN